MSRIDSPCVDVCRIEPETGLCAGCARTLEEIAHWSAMTGEERAAIMKALPARRAAAAQAQATPEQRLVYLLPDSADPGADGNPMLKWPKGIDPFAASARLEANAAQASVQIVPKAFNAAECERIIALGEAGETVAGRTEKAEGHRSSLLTWISPGQKANWLYHRVALLFLHANRAYRLALSGLAEPLQFARYGEAGYFDWHSDMGVHDTSGRKLSLTVQLVPPERYDGGDLEFLALPGRAAPRDPGTAVLFPAYLPHRVTPVRRGQRLSLVAWAYGPALR